MECKKTYSLDRFMLINIFLLVTCSFAFSQEKSNYFAVQPGESKEEIIQKAANVVPAARQLRWQQLEMTVFFHFGMNTYTGKEWGNGKDDPALFNPENLDAEQWIMAVKDAGFKQVILTTKHHDGFCLWPTATTEYSVKSSQWKEGRGDVVEEVARACRKYQVGFGIYLSPWDRNAACYGTDTYNDFFTAQLTELLTQYGTIDEVWFDGANGEGPDGKKQEYDFMRWYRLIRELQPQAVIAIMGPDVRWVGTESGMGRETEWSVIPVRSVEAGGQGGMEFINSNSPENLIYEPLGNLMEPDLGSREKLAGAKGLIWYPAETDVSIRPGWFYHEAEDSLVKTPKQLMEIYFTSVGMNSVLLLNIPPDRTGRLNAHDVGSLEGFKQLFDRTFGGNLAAGAEITNNSDTATTLEIALPSAQTFNLLVLQENITIGQRIEAFELECMGEDGNWRTLAEGTTVGYKRIIRFETVTAQKIRLKMLSARLNPAVSEFGLYLYTE